MMPGEGNSDKNIEKFSKSDKSERRLDNPDAQEAREADYKTITELQEGDKLPPVFPGEILRTEFLEPLKLSATKLATLMGVPATRITAIPSYKERRCITADTALRLACVFKTSPEFWLNLQANYDIAMLDYTGDADKIRMELDFRISRRDRSDPAYSGSDSDCAQLLTESLSGSG